MPEETGDDGDDEQAPGSTTLDGEGDADSLQGKVEQLTVAVATLEETDREREDRLDDLETRVEDYRRRGERERESLAAETLADFADRMLSVKDSLDNVLAMGDLDEDTERQVELVRKQFEKSFTSREIERIDADGTFDAGRHKMVERIETEEYDEGEIVRELDAGYAIGERVLRPARVVVAADTDD